MLLGAAAVLLGAFGVWWVLTQDDPLNGEVALRVAVILGAVWLVAPMIRRPGVTAVVASMAAALVILRPRLIVVVAVAAILWRLSGRRRPDR